MDSERRAECGYKLATGIITKLGKAYASQEGKRNLRNKLGLIIRFTDSGRREHRVGRHKYIDKTRSLKCCQVFGTLPRIQQDAHGETFTDNSEPGDDRTGHFRDETEEPGNRGAETEGETQGERVQYATAPRGDKGRTQGCERTWREPSNVLLGLSYKSRRACECKGNRQLGADRDKRIQAQVM